MTEKIIRVNAKETAKGLWYLEVTGEKVTSNDVDILKVIQEKEKEFQDDNRQMVDDK